MGVLFFANKKTRSTLSIGVAACVSVSTLVAQSCSKTSQLNTLTREQVINNQTQSVTVNFCTDPAVQQKYVEKMIVVLDHSGSNQENFLMDPNGDGAPVLNSSGAISIETAYATDPLGSLRYGGPTATGTLLNYLATTPANDPANPQKYFALVDFNASITTYPANSSGFDSNVQDFYNYVLADATSNAGNPTDGGYTNYLGALTAVYNLITADVQAAKTCAALPTTTTPTTSCPNPGVQVASSYVIIFASDGSPITTLTEDFPSGGGPPTIDFVEQTTDQVLGEVQAIMGETSNTQFVAGINIFTIYYYNLLNNLDLNAQSLLAQMAKAGGGSAYSAVSGTQLNYQQFLPPSKTIKYTLSDVFVTNASVVWWSDGALHPDTDMDGLPDDVETAWGSNPLVADTNGNGVSDGVEYQLAHGASCGSKNAQGFCTAVTDYKDNQCSGIPHTTAASSVSITGSATVFNSSDPDGFNDCEKLLLSDTAGINNPDSNNDIIPDWLEFINGVPFQVGAASAASTTQTNGVTTYNEVKNSLPVNYPLTQLLNLQPSNYSLTQTSTSGVQDCYNLVVTGLPVIGSQNTVRVDVIEKSELLQQSYLYRVGKKAFPVGSQTLQFNDWNNASEQALGTWKTWQ